MTADCAERTETGEQLTIAALQARILELEAGFRGGERLAKLNQFLKNVNKTLVDVADSAVALDRICQCAVTDAGFVLAWVGVRDDRLRLVAPTCAHGPKAAYVDEIVITIDPDLATSRGPTAKCALEQRTVYVDDFQTDPSMEPWRALAAKYNLHSSLSFPLVVRGSTRQVLSLYSDQRGYFDAEVRAALNECAQRISLTLATRDAEKELTSRNRLLRNISVMAVVGAWEMDPRTRKVIGSFEAAAILGFDQAGAFMDVDILRAFMEPDASTFQRSLAETVGRGAPFDLELRMRITTGAAKWLRIIGAADVVEGEVTRVFGTLQDITASKQAVTVLAESVDRYRSLMMAMDEGVVLQDKNATIIAFNDSAARILGLTPDQLWGQTPYDPRWRAVHEDGSPFDGDAHPVAQTLRSGVPQSNVVMGVHKADGALTWISISAQPLFRAGEPKPYRTVATMVDITVQKSVEAQLILSSQTDGLTGLFNRAGFIAAVRVAMAEAADDGRLTAALMLDLDQFTDVNDTLGPRAGDSLLEAIAARLTEVQPEPRIIGRFGGDEFAILLRGVEDVSEIDRIANRLLNTIIKPVNLDGIDVRLGVSVGVAVSDRREIDAETLLSRANLALNQAKSQGRGLIRHFTEAMEEAARRRVTLGCELHAAIDGGQLRLVYQPQLDAATGTIIGAEALVRWDHPVRGVVGPSEFIPISESVGLATAIGRWVIEDACRQIRTWLDSGLSPPPVAINLSATHFTTSGELERDLETAMARYLVTPDRLELELTETVLMKSAGDHSETLLRLRARGFSLSIDDFGTGYSSLDYLRRFPADRIKIDQTFIKDINSTPSNEAIVKAVIGLARQMGMGVIAEGVETKIQCDLLRAWDCGHMQGYYFARPVSADVFTAFLETGQPLPA